MTPRIKELKAKYDKCIAEKQLLRCVHKTIVFLVLNKEMTHFEKRVVHSDTLDFWQQNVSDYFKEDS